MSDPPSDELEEAENAQLSAESDGDSDASSEASVELMIAGREKRSTAGNRLRDLLDLEDSLADDADDGMADIFAELDDDEDFESSEQEDEDALADDVDEDDLDQEEAQVRQTSDEVLNEERLPYSNHKEKSKRTSTSKPSSFGKRPRLSDRGDDNETEDHNDDENFSSSSSDSADEDAAGEGEDSAERDIIDAERRERQRKRKRQEQRIIGRPAPTSLSSSASQPSVPRERVPRSARSKASTRASSRAHTVKNKQDVLERLQLQQKRKSSLPSHHAKEHIILTQAERLERAKQIEEYNVASLNRFFDQEVTRKRNQRAAMYARRIQLGPSIRWVSSIKDVAVSDCGKIVEEVVLSNPTLVALPRTSKPFPETDRDLSAATRPKRKYKKRAPKIDPNASKEGDVALKDDDNTVPKVEDDVKVEPDENIAGEFGMAETGSVQYQDNSTHAVAIREQSIAQNTDGSTDGALPNSTLLSKNEVTIAPTADESTHEIDLEDTTREIAGTTVPSDSTMKDSTSDLNLEPRIEDDVKMMESREEQSATIGIVGTTSELTDGSTECKTTARESSVDTLQDSRQNQNPEMEMKTTEHYTKDVVKTESLTSNLDIDSDKPYAESSRENATYDNTASLSLQSEIAIEDSLDISNRIEEIKKESESADLGHMKAECDPESPHPIIDRGPTVTRTTESLTLINFDADENIDAPLVRSILFGEQSARGKAPPRAERHLCPVTGKLVRFFDPKTGVCYYDLDAYRVIQAVLAGNTPWNASIGEGMYYSGVDLEEILRIPNPSTPLAHSESSTGNDSSRIDQSVNSQTTEQQVSG
ncbi:YL1 nuclear protein-domain-containing protein [Lipomyces oligophaga]|uniref:YL1 nuclear protein-domain-containing protein n=1 Tax=Lipomyces oligophaga TaxID=45792 RepID=UPI0034CFEE7D